MNSKGFATLLTVMVLSTCLVVTLMVIYVYQVNNARHHARIKETYRLMYVMEESAKSIRSAWDNAATAVVNDPTYQGDCGSPAGTKSTNPACVTDIASKFPSYLNSCTGGAGVSVPNCCNWCSTHQGGTPTMCFDNPESTNYDPYCFYGGSTTTAEFEFRLKNPEDSVAPTIADRFYARLNRFFEGAPEAVNGIRTDDDESYALRAPTLWNWVLAEKKALAYTVGSYATTCGSTAQVGCVNVSLGGTLPSCGKAGVAVTTGTSAASGCVACGPGTSHACASVYACPTSFSQCNATGGTAWTAGGTNSGTTAAFAQQFALSPPGACTNPTGGTGVSGSFQTTCY